MANTVKHKFVSAIADGADTALVRPQADWNVEHAFAGGLIGHVLIRDTAETDGAKFGNYAPVNLLNNTGVALAAGDVVALSGGADEAVALGDTVNSRQVYVVARAAIAIGTRGEFGRAGVVSVGVTGAVTRGNYLVKSATTKVLQDGGVVPGATALPPRGTVGIALQAAAGPGLGTILAFLFGFTEVRADITTTPIPAGTVMPFFQAAAPTGWTQVTTQNDKALRVVSGAGGGVGGTTVFSAAWPAKQTGGTAISIAQMPSHAHDVQVQGAIGGSFVHIATIGDSQAPSTLAARALAVGGGAAHDHSISTYAPQFINMILASKD